MGQQTAIEWTDHTFNPWIGCQRVHTGCIHCYAEELMDKRYGKAKWGPNGTRVMTSNSNWRKVFGWDRQAEKDGVRRRVFCASLADVFEDWTGPIRSHRGKYIHRGEAWGSKHSLIETGYAIGQSIATMDDLRKALFQVIDATPHLDWLLLTKRPENIRRMWPRNPVPMGPSDYRAALAGELHVDNRPNVWLGTSVSNQETADKAVPELLKCRDLSPVLFLSAEPLVGPADLSPWLKFARFEEQYREIVERCGGEDRIPDHLRWNGKRPPAIDWVIAGGESGHGARPCDVSWVRWIVTQCQASRVPCFVKQMGANVVERFPSPWPNEFPNGDRSLRLIGNNAGQFSITGLHDSKGGDWMEWPEDLRVRQFPTPAETN